MSDNIIGELKSSPVIKRHPANPILSAKDVPYPAALVFNAGVTKRQGKYVMVFRNDYGSLEEHRLEGTNLGLAFSDDGIIGFQRPYSTSSHLAFESQSSWVPESQTDGQRRTPSAQ